MKDEQESKMKCLDALTCINAFMYHYKAHTEEPFRANSKAFEDLAKRMSSVYALCDNYGLVPKGNVFNS
jgi:hypothetical protein